MERRIQLGKLNYNQNVFNILITRNKLLKAQLPQFWLRGLAVLLIHSLTKFSQHPINKKGLGGEKIHFVSIGGNKVLARR